MFVDICLLTFMQIYVVINVIKEIEAKHRFVSHTLLFVAMNILLWTFDIFLYVFWYTYFYVFRL